MTLRLIRLELARNAEYPAGSANHGYEFVAPLNAGGRIDLEEWGRFKEACTVRRFWGSEETEHGMLIRARGNRWAFSYETGDEDDEPIYHFAEHVFREGEYATITEHDGESRPFRVASVSDPPALRSS